MVVLALPPQLAPIVEDGAVVSQVVIDLTLYLERPTVDDFNRVLDIYRRSCPADRISVYATGEAGGWDSVDDPLLTRQGYLARGRGESWPFCAVVRSRIADRRPFEFQLWDGKETDSYSLNFRCVRERHGAPSHAFVRFMFPLSIDCRLLQALAERCADVLPIRSGHGGLCLSYRAWDKERGFTLAYARARRWWGLDIEDLNLTLPLMTDRIKGAQWLTVLGGRFAGRPDVAAKLERSSSPVVEVSRRRNAAVIVAGPHPVVGDQHQADPGLAPYEAVARMVQPVTLERHPDFGGEHFPEHGNTIGWLHRFTDPEGWR